MERKIMRGAAAASILIVLALAVTGCSSGQGGDPNAPPYTYSGYSGGGVYSDQMSTCGALGTCAPSNAIRITPNDIHGGW